MKQKKSLKKSLKKITLGGAFIVAAEKWDDTSVYLHAGNDSSLFQQFGERSSIFGLLVQSLVEENYTGDVVSECGTGCE